MKCDHTRIGHMFFAQSERGFTDEGQRNFLSKKIGESDVESEIASNEYKATKYSP